MPRVNDNIPPRPWRLSDSHGLCIVDADGNVVADSVCEGTTVLSRDTASLIVRLVNAEAQVVMTLERARNLASFPSEGGADDEYRRLKTLEAVDRAFALLRGDRPAEGGE